MRRAPWTAALAAAALVTLPAAALAQTPQQPQTSRSAQQSAKQQVDVAGAKKHLSEARATLSQLTSMPEAAKLQGDARTQVSQLISNFNDLITTQADWRSAYGKVDANLTALLGPDAAADQPVGTGGSVTAAPAGKTELDPAIRAKLTEFRTHLKAFETAADGSSSNNAGAMPPANPTPTTANPSYPTAGAPTAANPTQPDPNKPAATSGVSPASPTASMNPTDRAEAQAAVNAPSDAPNADAQKELNAIAAILDRSRGGALTRVQVAQLRRHVETLQVLLAKK